MVSNQFNRKLSDDREFLVLKLDYATSIYPLGINQIL